VDTGQVGSLEYCRWTVGQVDKWIDTKAHNMCWTSSVT
jgi:hypothetical protein